jgi:hypothetical protein
MTRRITTMLQEELGKVQGRLTPWNLHTLSETRVKVLELLLVVPTLTTEQSMDQGQLGVEQVELLQNHCTL